MTDATLIVLVGFAGTATTVVVGLYKESRNRKWDQQDRERAAEILRLATVQAALDVKREAEIAAEELSEKVMAAAKLDAAKIRADVAENTRVSEAAKTAAENASAQIEDVKADVVDLKENGFTSKKNGK